MSASTRLVSDSMDTRKVAVKAPAREMRRPPAYQTYASDDLASEGYYGLGLASRGLFDAMLRAIWVNGYVPKEPALLAKAVRAELAEVTAALVPQLMEQFDALQTEPRRLTYSELERQRTNLQLQRERQRLGGKKGAERRYRSQAGPDNHPMGKPMGRETNCNEASRAEKKRNPVGREYLSPRVNSANELWANEYDAEEKRIEVRQLAPEDQGDEYGK